MASVSKRLATDETLMLLVNAVNNTETVKQAKAEIQAEGTAQVNNVRSTAEEMVKDINQVPKNTSDIAELNSNLDALEYSDVAGGKNLLDPNYFTSQIVKVGGIGNVNGVSWDCDKVNWYIEDLSGISFKENTVYTIMLYGKCKNNEQSLTNLCIEYTDGTNSIIMFSSKNTNSLALRVTDSNKTISKLAFYYGSRGTDLDPKKCGIFEGTIKESDFEPYIPSVKILADEVSTQNESLDVIGKCKNLLNPILKTTTVNGVTCTDNGDGTYTFNGTSTNPFQVIVGEVEMKGNQQYKTVGCPTGAINKEYCLIPYNATDGAEFGKYDYGDGSIGISKKDITYRLYIYVAKGVTVSNLVFKPMITTNINATYDDFVPYTGEGETLTHDVADLKNDLGGLSFSVSGTTLSITDGTNTWNLSAN